MRTVLIAFLLILSCSYAAMAATPVFYVSNEVIVIGEGVVGVKQIEIDLLTFVKSELVKKQMILVNDDSQADYTLKFKVETDIERSLFGGKIYFNESSITMMKNGISVETSVYNQRTAAGSLMTYGKEGAAYAKKAAENLVANLLQTDLVAKFEKKNTGRQMATSKQPDVTRETSGIYNNSVGSMPKGKGAGKYDIAVIFGNKNYKKTSNVDYAKNDAMKMKELVIKTLGFQSENIIYVEDATLTDFTETFGSQKDDEKSKLYNFIKPNVSNVFVYYVGHGAPDIKAEKPEAYFVPVDADPQYISASGYKVQSLYDNLAKLPAKSITVVLDSCFSGNSPRGLLFKGISALVRVDKGAKMPAKNSIVMTSTSENQVSSWYEEKQHSLFTYFFLKGLQGEADKNMDKKITAGELEEYLSENVASLSKRLTGNLQQPTLSGDSKKVLTSLD